MFVKITIVCLIITQACWAEDEMSDNNSTNIEVPKENFCNNVMLAKILHKLDLIQATNDNLQLKIDLLNEQLNKKIDSLHETLHLKIDSLSKQDLNQDIKSQNTNITPERNNNTGDLHSTLPATNCAEALKENGQNGIYQIKIPNSKMEPFKAYCLKNNTNDKQKDANPANSSSIWMIIQRRMDGSIDFYRNWTDYQQGFGSLDGEFFIGLEKLHALTESTVHELWIQMENFEGEKRWAKYNHFVIGNASEGYALKSVGNFSGDAGDSLTYHTDYKWSTYDVDNDMTESINCAQKYQGAWWYEACYYSNLNGQYLQAEVINGKVQNDFSYDEHARAISWNTFHEKYLTYLLKYVHMAIRPV